MTNIDSVYLYYVETVPVIIKVWTNKVLVSFTVMLAASFAPKHVAFDRMT